MQGLVVTATPKELISNNINSHQHTNTNKALSILILYVFFILIHFFRNSSPAQPLTPMSSGAAIGAGQGSNANPVTVCVRVRPLNSDERDAQMEACFRPSRDALNIQGPAQ